MAASSSNSPCAACKFLRRKCTQGCVFAPYFPPDQPAKFTAVHRVFGASNVAKLLNELSSEQREDAVSSLAYEAEARLRDPVYGCVGYISVLQRRLKQLQEDLLRAKKELSSYAAAAAQQSFLTTIHHRDQHHHHLHQEMGASNSSQQILETQRLAREPNAMLGHETWRYAGGGSGGFSYPRGVISVTDLESGMPPPALHLDDQSLRKGQHHLQEQHHAGAKFYADERESGGGHAHGPQP